jgi:hypothetical protein
MRPPRQAFDLADVIDENHHENRQPAENIDGSYPRRGRDDLLSESWRDFGARLHGVLDA